MTGIKGRRKQVLLACAILGTIALLMTLLLPLSYVPGVIGEFFARIAGIITTPFLMEATFLIVGFIIVMALNYWNRRRDGDELVYLDELPESRKDSDAGDPP